VELCCYDEESSTCGSVRQYPSCSGEKCGGGYYSGSMVPMCGMVTLLAESLENAIPLLDADALHH